MNDYLVRIVTKAGNVRGIACVTTELVNHACRQHGTNPTASDALGRVLTCGAMMGALVKDKQRVALKFEGNGPLKKILVEANNHGEVRGYVSVPEVDLLPRNGKPDVASAIGKAGFLTVTRDLRLKEPYKGIIQLYTSEIAEDLALYLTESEQVPSAVGVGVLVAPDKTVAVAGGFLIQSLPPADKALIEQLVHQIEQMPPLTELLVQGKTPEDLFASMFTGIPYDVLETQPLVFRCSCNKHRIEHALIALGIEDLTQLIQEGGASVFCEFCRTPYHFSREELEQILERIQ